MFQSPARASSIKLRGANVSLLNACLSGNADRLTNGSSWCRFLRKVDGGLSSGALYFTG